MTAPLPRLLLPALAAIALAGCGDVLAFDLYAAVDEFTVPGDPHLHHGNAPLEKAQVPPIEIQIGAVQAGSIHLSALRLYITETSIVPASDTDDLEFLTRVEVLVSPTTAGSQLPVLAVAEWKGPATPDMSEVVLVVEDQYDLSPYVAEGFQLDLRTEGVVPYDDVSLAGEVVFRVDPL